MLQVFQSEERARKGMNVSQGSFFPISRSQSWTEKRVRPCRGAESIRKVKVVSFPLGDSQKITRQALNTSFHFGNFYTALNEYLFSKIQHNVVPRAAHCFTE